MQKIANFNKDNVHPKTIKKITNLLNKSDLSPEKVRAANLACFSLYVWVMAIINYRTISSEIREDNEKVKILKEQYNNITDLKTVKIETNIQRPDLSIALGPIIDRQYCIENDIKNIIQDVLLSKILQILKRFDANKGLF